MTTDDPHVRHLAIVLTPEAVAGLITTCASIERASADGTIKHIAEALHLALQVDDATGEPPDDQPPGP